MQFKWLVVIVSIWILLALLGGIMEGAYLEHGEQGHLNTIMSSKVVESTTIWGKIAGLFTDRSFWDALGNIIIFNFAMFEGPWVILQWVFFLPLAVATLVTILLSLVGRITG